MFAVIKTGGKQYVVTPDAKLKVEKLNAEEGEDVVFDEVLLMVDGDPSKNSGQAIKVGNPTVEGVSVVGEVQKQGRGDKVIVFKYKKRKRYKKKRGHRQLFTEVQIKSIGGSKPKKVLRTTKK